jgi:hypothetical protein
MSWLLVTIFHERRIKNNEMNQIYISRIFSFKYFFNELKEPRDLCHSTIWRSFKNTKNAYARKFERLKGTEIKMQRGRLTRLCMHS